MDVAGDAPHGATLLCVLRWGHPENAAKAFSLADVSLTETAVCWRDYVTAAAARAEMERRCEESTQLDGVT